MQDFFTNYFAYAGVTTSEAPATFHRWSAISMLSALLGRQCYIPFGHSKIYPNQYIMIMGTPGTRKSSAINIATGLLRDSGYTRFSSDRTSKERFLMDMRKIDEPHLKGIERQVDELLDMTLDEPSESYVAIGEFTDFIGQNNMEFVTMLTNLWDNPNDYTNPKIHGKSVVVNKPTVNILGGNTAQGFSLAFPPEALGNGFLSRLIFVHGETTGRKVTFPAPPDELLRVSIVEHMKEMRTKVQGEVSITDKGKTLLDKMYREDIVMDDHRFKHYATRRFTHLLKLCMVIAASRLSLEINEQDIMQANTVLVNAERKMPKALGEFGKGKHSDVSNKILEIMNESTKPMNAIELYKKVSNDLNKITELHDILRSLQDADKIENTKISGKQGFMPKHTTLKEWDKDLILQDYLITEETK